MAEPETVITAVLLENREALEMPGFDQCETEAGMPPPFFSA
jgi:hypothetical protein